MRRKGHPTFPSAMSCCFFSLLKTLLMAREPAFCERQIVHCCSVNRQLLRKFAVLGTQQSLDHMLSDARHDLPPFLVGPRLETAFPAKFTGGSPIAAFFLRS